MNSHQQNVSNMLKNDFFSEWLGIQLISLEQGKAVLQMKVRKEMLNGFGILHGGISFSLADSAIAFAANSLENIAVTTTSYISYHKSAVENDVLLVEASLIDLTSKIGHFNAVVKNQHNQLIASAKATVYQTSKTHTF
jgi:acyl-CoA thioesterase